ncbi:MAG: hypothetical protein V1752_01975, partial [Candidatus Firestonebacteria bacterium]
LLEKKKLLEALEKKSAELFVKLFLDDSADLVFLGRMYYLFGEKKYIDLFPSYQKSQPVSTLNYIVESG